MTMRSFAKGSPPSFLTNPTWCSSRKRRVGERRFSKYREHRPDVTLMDLRMPDLSGIEALLAIRSEFPEARIIILTTFESDEEVRRAAEAGACGYLLKSLPPSQLVRAIRDVHAGKKAIGSGARFP
jgi:DNA-binding NarL/FixJ family response regulator